jgi:hypothetical protein
MNTTKLLTTALTGPNGLARFPRKRLRIALPTALALSVTLSACSSFGAAWSGEAPPVNSSSTALSQATPDSTTTSTTTPGLDPVPVVVASSGGPVWERYSYETDVFYSSTYQPDPGAPIQVTEVPSGCQASPTSGTTDSEGDFTTDLTCYGPFDYTAIAFSTPPGTFTPPPASTTRNLIGYQGVVHVTIDHANSTVPYPNLEVVPGYPSGSSIPPSIPPGCSWSPVSTYTDSSGSATLTFTCAATPSVTMVFDLAIGARPDSPNASGTWQMADVNMPYWGPVG